MADETILRAFAAPLDAGDGRTIIGRCVPYNTPTTVAEPGGEPYVEVWRRGAFRNVIKAPHMTQLRYEHQPTIMALLGQAIELTETDDGLDGVFRAAPGDVGNHALELIRAGMLTGLSVECIVPKPGARNADGHVERTSVRRLLHVALVHQPAYAGAGVTATRSAGDALAPGIAASRCAQDRYRLRSGSTT